MRTVSLCVLTATLILPTLADSSTGDDRVNARRAASEALKATPFDLVCTFLSGPVSPASNDLMTETMRYSRYALLREHPSFEVKWSGAGNMVLTPTDRSPMNYLVTVAQPDVDGHALVEFSPADDDDDSGDVYVRFAALNAQQRWPDAFTVVEHVKLYDDSFGAQGLKRAKYECATPAQIKAYDSTKSGIACEEKPFPPEPDAKGVEFDCRDPAGMRTPKM